MGCHGLVCCWGGITRRFNTVVICIGHRYRCSHRRGRCCCWFGCCWIGDIVGAVSIGAVGFDGVRMVMVEEMVGRRRRRWRRRRRRPWYLMLLLELRQTADKPIAARRRWRRGGRLCVCVDVIGASALKVDGRGIKVAGGMSRSPLLCGRLCSVAHEDILVCPYSETKELGCLLFGTRGFEDWRTNGLE